MFKLMCGRGYETFLRSRNDTPAVTLPAGSRNEATRIIDLLRATPGVAHDWPVLSVIAGDDASS